MSFTVERRRSKLAAPKVMAPRAPKPRAGDALPLSDLIGRVVSLKDKARTLRAVGHTTGHEAFAEDKDALHRGLCRLEDDLRRRGVAGE